MGKEKGRKKKMKKERMNESKLTTSRGRVVCVCVCVCWKTTNLVSDLALGNAVGGDLARDGQRRLVGLSLDHALVCQDH
jgi:hypothetical protein